MGFLRDINENQSEYRLPQPHTHSLVCGETGAGKTVGMLLNIIQNEIKEHKSSIFLIDEKNTLHIYLKHLLGESSLSDIYQLGSTIGYGKHDITINLLDIATGTKKAETEFFELIAGVNHEDDSSRHDFWAQGAAKMMQDFYSFLKSIKNFMEEVEINSFTKKYPLYDSKKTEILSTCQVDITSKPTTLSELSKYFCEDREEFIVICDNSEDIAKYLVLEADEMLNKIDRDMAVRIDTLIDSMNFYAKKLKKHIVDTNVAEASGNNGIYFTAASTLSGALSETKAINDPEPKHDILELLESGKHIVVNSESLPKVAINTISNRVLRLLSLRAKRVGPQKVSFICDEASSVLNKKSNLEGILAFGREAGLRIHLAVQSRSQLEKLFGELEWNSMEDNFTDIYQMSAAHEPLKKFCYTSKNDQNELFKTKPIFVDKRDLMKTEKLYQITTAQYNNLDIDQNETIVYDSRLYEEKSLLLAVNQNTLKERDVLYISPEPTTSQHFIEKAKHQEAKELERWIKEEDKRTEQEFIDQLLEDLYNEPEHVSGTTKI